MVNSEPQATEVAFVMRDLEGARRMSSPPLTFFTEPVPHWPVEFKPKAYASPLSVMTAVW